MDRQFFIVGCGRSGTTMLQQALNRHSQIVIPPETRFCAFLRFAQKAQRQHLRRVASDLGIDVPPFNGRIRRDEDARRLFSYLARRYLNRLGRREPVVFGEKSGENLLYIGKLRTLFPDSKIIVMYRDGRDVALSLSKVPWAHRDLYVNFAVWLHYYKRQAIVTTTKMPNVLLLKYEDVVSRPRCELTRVLTFLGLGYEPDVAEGFGNDEGIPGWEHAWKARALGRISDSRVGLWRTELSAQQIAILECWGAYALGALGYELSASVRHRLSPFFFVRLGWKLAVWRAAKYVSNCRTQLLGDDSALIEQCNNMGTGSADIT